MRSSGQSQRVATERDAKFSVHVTIASRGSENAQGDNHVRCAFRKDWSAHISPHMAEIRFLRLPTPFYLVLQVTPWSLARHRHGQVNLYLR